jgi:hypothetical protein
MAMCQSFRLFLNCIIVCWVRAESDENIRSVRSCEELQSLEKKMYRCRLIESVIQTSDLLTLHPSGLIRLLSFKLMHVMLKGGGKYEKSSIL